MAGVASCAAVLLAGVFAAAGVAKLRDPVATSETFRDLGLPRPALLGRAVPVTELAVAVLLLVSPAVGGLAALAALAFFTTVLATRLRAGARASCGCFGTTGDQPISFVELVRNAVFASFAVAALFAPTLVRPALEDVITTTTGALVGLLVLALCGMRRDVGSVWDNTLAGEARR